MCHIYIEHFKATDCGFKFSSHKSILLCRILTLTVDIIVEIVFLLHLQNFWTCLKIIILKKKAWGLLFIFQKMLEPTSPSLHTHTHTHAHTHTHTHTRTHTHTHAHTHSYQYISCTFRFVIFCVTSFQLVITPFKRTYATFGNCSALDVHPSKSGVHICGNIKWYSKLLHIYMQFCVCGDCLKLCAAFICIQSGSCACSIFNITSWDLNQSLCNNWSSAG